MILHSMPYEEYNKRTNQSTVQTETDYVLNSEGIYVPKNENDNLDTLLEEE